MKKRILLSLVSFFAMTAMWASIVDAYQIYVTAAANGKTGATAELTLNMKNRLAIETWQCDLVLPEGVTYQSVAIVDGRYPEGYEPEITVTEKADGSISFACVGNEGVALTGTDGAVAIVTVAIAADAPLGDCIVKVKDIKLVENGNIHEKASTEITWTIEQGETGPKGDLNGDERLDIADGVIILKEMAAQGSNPKYDLNNDGRVDVADFVIILTWIAENAQQ